MKTQGIFKPNTLPKETGDMYGLKRMEVGDAVLIPRKNGQSDQAYSQNVSGLIAYRKKHFPDREYRSGFSEEHSSYMVWRVA